MKEIRNTHIKMALKDIFLFIVWGKFANVYFDRSSSWLYNKFNGRDGNGGIGEFTEAEKERLKMSLLDFSDKIRKTAESL